MRYISLALIVLIFIGCSSKRDLTLNVGKVIGKSLLINTGNYLGVFEVGEREESYFYTF